MRAVSKDALALIEKKITAHPDFPKKGILFRDLTPVYREPSLRDDMIEAICYESSKYQVDAVVGIESRGFILGSFIASRLSLPFELVRKKGKLPGELHSVDYELEYGKDTLQMQKGGLKAGCKCLLVDDLIATGGSLEASKQLIVADGAEITMIAVVIELEALGGRKKLGDSPFFSLFRY